MLSDANLSEGFWGEAIATAAYISNLTPKLSLNNKTPEEIWNGKRPDISHLRIFGCKAMVKVPDNQRSKIDKKSMESFMVGYAHSQKAYRLWCPKLKKIVIARDVEFFETLRIEQNVFLNPLHTYHLRQQKNQMFRIRLKH